MADGDERRWVGRGDAEVPSLRVAGEATEGVGLAFSRKRLLTLSEVNFFAGIPAIWDGEAAAAARLSAAEAVALLSDRFSARSCRAVKASTSRSDVDAVMVGCSASSLTEAVCDAADCWAPVSFTLW